MLKSNQSNLMLEAKIKDAIEWVMKTNKRKFLHFLDPAQQELCTRLVKNNIEVQANFFGGHAFSERKIICIHPRDSELTVWEWPIAVFHLKPKHKYRQLKHPDILGTLINLGIKREKIGDINITDQYMQVFIAEELRKFLCLHLEMISSVQVDIEEIDWNQVIAFEPDFNKLFISSSSMRTDGILSGVYGLSRRESSYLITSGKVKVNWQPIEKPSTLLKEKDVISIRGKGRALIYEIIGESKKGNKKILIHKFK